jgi:hypothetical protein
MTMSCDRASFLMSKKQDKPLSFGEKVSLKWHFIVCAACMHTEKQYRRIREICGLEEMKVMEGPEVKDCCLDDGVKDDLKKRLSEAQESG